LSKNPVLNKSFDVLPQAKDDDIPSADPIADTSVSQRKEKNKSNSPGEILFLFADYKYEYSRYDS